MWSAGCRTAKAALRDASAKMLRSTRLSSKGLFELNMVISSKVGLTSSRMIEFARFPSSDTGASGGVLGNNLTLPASIYAFDVDPVTHARLPSKLLIGHGNLYQHI
ncbi:hypothetical protein C8R41DRAFT_508181 [Lentinula lateritia]|uniref:Uncharacterized protein n=1 Tax=Lentinula lateritia TaxID=40482 RepID=A0ABQ8V7R0_9AGAR|nr:hypothetical protein C8R41DRAFT_508181 [Lentinula lateritia]